MALDDGSQSKGSLVGKALGHITSSTYWAREAWPPSTRRTSPSLERCIALKVLFPHFAEPEFVARFKREALAAAPLNHPSIVHVYDAGEIDGYYYIAMEYIEGGTLKDRLDERGHEPLDSDTILQVWRASAARSNMPTARALSIATSSLRTSCLRATAASSWPIRGLAKFFEATDLTQMTALIGTPYYMSPEQARSQGVDARSDLYSFGVVLYEMLTGRVPFEADTPWMAIHQHIYEAPPPVRERNPLISEDVAQVVTKALAKEPSQRYQHAEELVQALVQTQQPVAASRPAAPPNTLHPPQSAAPRRGVSPFLLWAGGVLSVLVLLGAALLWNPGGQLWPWRGASAVLSMTATPTSSPLTYALFGTGTPSLVPPTVTASPTQSATATALARNADGNSVADACSAVHHDVTNNDARGVDTHRNPQCDHHAYAASVARHRHRDAPSGDGDAYGYDGAVTHPHEHASATAACTIQHAGSVAVAYSRAAHEYLYTGANTYHTGAKPNAQATGHADAAPLTLFDKPKGQSYPHLCPFLLSLLQHATRAR